MFKLSIVIPVYFNEDTLQSLYNDLSAKVLQKLDDYEIIMVDDGSKDKSWKIMNALADNDKKIKLIKLSRNFGSHAAMLAGMLECSGDCVAIKAADLQEESELLLKMYDSWKLGNKIVLAIRETRDDGKFNNLFGNLYYKIIQKIVLHNMPDKGFDCFLIDRKAIEVLRLLEEKNSAITLQILWMGFKTDKIYYNRKKRVIGKSKWTLAKKTKLVVDSVMSFSYAPIRFVSGVGVSFFIFSLLWAIYLIANKLVYGATVQGWTTLMVMILCTSGMILLTLGILGEYVWRILDAARNRPPYIIEETNNAIKVEKRNEQ